MRQEPQCLKKRLDLKVGYSCNNNCRFCVIADKRSKGDKTSEQIRKDLEAGLANGAEGVVFTGGEPTLRRDLPDLIHYAKQLGYSSIQIQTNGRRFAYPDFVEKLRDAGATEFSPALHGHIEQLHDYLTRCPKSFSQTVKGIKNLKESGAFVLTNSVVTKPNYRHLPDIAELLIRLGVDQFQLAFVHPSGNAYANFDNIVPRKELVKPFIKKAMDLAKDAGIRAMVEAYPFCFMEGYEELCSELYIPPTEIRDIGSVDPDFGNTRVREGKAKHGKCRACRYDLVCEGPWREYPERVGWGEFKPVAGPKVRKGEWVGYGFRS